MSEDEQIWTSEVMGSWSDDRDEIAEVTDAMSRAMLTDPVNYTSFYDRPEDRTYRLDVPYLLYVEYLGHHPKVVFRISTAVNIFTGDFFSSPDEKIGDKTTHHFVIHRMLNKM